MRWLRNKVAKLHYALHDSDRILTANERAGTLRTPIDHGPVISQEMPAPIEEYIDAGFAVCEMMHLAAVAKDKESFVAFGVADSIRLLDETWEKLVTAGTKAAASSIQDEALDCLELPSDTRLVRVQEIRLMRENPLKIRHKVAEVFPELRIWPRDVDYDKESDEEVQLRHHGGLRLGGILCPELMLK